MDLTMPRLDGVQAFREMRTIQPEVPVVLMSGFSEQEAVSRFTGRGLAGFVHKPYDLRQLESVLRAALKE
jgi:DNA-binding NtrC family response regulator